MLQQDNDKFYQFLMIETRRNCVFSAVSFEMAFGINCIL